MIFVRYVLAYKYEKMASSVLKISFSNAHLKLASRTTYFHLIIHEAFKGKPSSVPSKTTGPNMTAILIVVNAYLTLTTFRRINSHPCPFEGSIMKIGFGNTGRYTLKKVEFSYKYFPLLLKVFK
jgi:hypothetical protein